MRNKKRVNYLEERTKTLKERAGGNELGRRIII